MLLTVFLITIVLVALAFAGLGLSIFFRRNGKFPETEVGSNRNMKNLGITCTRQDELKMYRQERKSGKPGSPATQSPLRDCGIGCSCVSEEF